MKIKKNTRLPVNNCKKKKIKIYEGECYVSREPAVLNTALASCVAVCIYDPVRKIGGMNHIKMPGRAEAKSSNALCYGINAMEQLLKKIKKSGGGSCLVAKVFGGGNKFFNKSSEAAVGLQNAACVTDFLEKKSIPIISRDTGGRKYRYIRFHTDTGKVSRAFL